MDAYKLRVEHNTHANQKSQKELNKDCPPFFKMCDMTKHEQKQRVLALCSLPLKIKLRLATSLKVKSIRFTKLLNNVTLNLL